MVRLAQTDDESCDLLLYCLSGVLPNVSPRDFGVLTKGEFRDSIRQQYMDRRRRNMSRLNCLSEELDNIPMAAVRLGYPPELLSPRLKQMLEYLRNSAQMSREVGFVPPNMGHQGANLPGARAPFALQDGALDETADGVAKTPAPAVATVPPSKPPSIRAALAAKAGDKKTTYSLPDMDLGRLSAGGTNPKVLMDGPVDTENADKANASSASGLGKKAEVANDDKAADADGDVEEEEKKKD